MSINGWMQNSCVFFPTLFLITTPLCLNLAFAQIQYQYYACYSSTGNYSNNSTYSSNLKELFSSLSTESVAIQGFSKNTIGAKPDQTSGLVLCRGDINPSMCDQCLNSSIVDITNLCPQSKEALIYYDYCLLRYSIQNFLNSTNNTNLLFLDSTLNVTGGRFSGWDSSNNTVKTYFNTVVNTLLSSVSDQAAYSSRKRFGTGVINITESLPVIYGLSQCTPDFSNDTCRACLQDLIDQMLQWFDGRQGGWILGVRCNLRYEIYTFFDGNPDIQLVTTSGTAVPNPSASDDKQTQPPSNTSKGGKNRLFIIIISLASSLFILACFIIFLWVRKLRYSETEDSQEESMLPISDETLNLWSRSSNFPLFNFNQIADATNNFSSDNKLGQGGFGPVYKGVLQDGLEIAVKRLSTYSGQGLIEFKNGIELIAKLQHRNLVRLLGWCIQGEEKVLVYEFMPNKSLDFFIFAVTWLQSMHLKVFSQSNLMSLVMVCFCWKL